MKNRTLRHKLFTDPDFMELTGGAKILYFALLCHADDHGVFRNRLSEIVTILPGHSMDQVANMRAELVQCGMIALDEGFGFIHGFMRDQRPGRPKPVHFPDGPPENWRNYLNGIDHDLPKLSEEDAKLLICGAAMKVLERHGMPVPEVTQKEKGELTEGASQLVSAEEAAALPSTTLPSVSEDVWKGRLRAFNERGKWFEHYGPKPGETGCLVPVHLVEE